MPEILGLIDGTLIEIIRPSLAEASYFCRKGWHAINCQMVTNANYEFISLRVKDGGRSHDSTIFLSSILCEEFRRGLHNGRLIGDSGYRLLAFLLTLYRNPTEDWQVAYNRALLRTRVIVEQAFGILKRRFACLSIPLRLKPDRACKVIVTCVILHNIARRISEPEDEIPPARGAPDGPPDYDLDRNARAARDVYARAVFGTL